MKKIRKTGRERVLECKLKRAQLLLKIAEEALHIIMMKGLSDETQQLPPNIQSLIARKALYKIRYLHE